MAVSAALRLFLTVKWQGVAVFAGDDVGEEGGGGKAALLEDGERSDDGGHVRIADGDVFASS